MDGCTIAQRKSIDLVGVPVDVCTEEEAVRVLFDRLKAELGMWVITANLDHLRRARCDPAYRRMLEQADLVVADGMPLVWASRIQGTPLPERVAGSSMVSTIAATAAARGRSLYLLGGAPEAAEGAAEILHRTFPTLRIEGAECPPLGFERSTRHVNEIRDRLRKAKPDIVYVALGSPKQEQVIQLLRDELPQACWIGVGVSFSFLCGHIRRAPRWMQRLGLEWMHRLIQEPRRLARRYLVDGMPFALHLLSAAACRRLAHGSAGRTHTIKDNHADRIRT